MFLFYQPHYHLMYGKTLTYLQLNVLLIILKKSADLKIQYNIGNE